MVKVGSRFLGTAFNMLNGMRWLRKEWVRNYRHRGGVLALTRCATGSLRLSLMPTVTVQPSSHLVEAVTFSVIPGMTALWSMCMEAAVMDSFARILVGDCSGGFKPTPHPDRMQVVPLLNTLHGVKLDLFFSKICQAEFVIISDDDVFWLDGSAWNWALEQFMGNERLAVVSLIPRTMTSSVLREKVVQAMGSYCIIVRREIWMREKLSFQIVYPPQKSGYDWFYDTGDYANVQLLDRGYQVAIAPRELRKGFLSLDGTSTWTLKIQENGGNIRSRLLDDIEVRSVKALQTVYALRGMAELINHFSFGNMHPYFVSPKNLNNAEKICCEFLSVDRQKQIRENANIFVSKLSERLNSIPLKIRQADLSLEN